MQIIKDAIDIALAVECNECRGKGPSFHALTGECGTKLYNPK